MTRTVLVDGNNVMGSRPDGWWRNRAEAAGRLVAELAPLARSRGGTWTIVFDGPEPVAATADQVSLSVVYTGHRRRDGADDCIVELVGALPDPSTALLYTSDSALRARVHALGAEVAGARVLLNEIAVPETPVIDRGSRLPRGLWLRLQSYELNPFAYGFVDCSTWHLLDHVESPCG